MNQLRALRSRLTYANVVATICLVAIVSGGTAVAATRLLTGADIKSSSLTGVDVKNSSLTGPDVKNASIAEAGLAVCPRNALAESCVWLEARAALRHPAFGLLHAAIRVA